MNVAYNMDCLEAMRQMPDKAFDLAVVDPPYGINSFRNNKPTRLNRYGSMATANDLKPTVEYFQQLFRVSKNQVIWGYNHLSDLLPTTKEFIFWYKHQCVETYSDGELAWTSFTKTAKCFDYPYRGAVGADPVRIHPTQKPVALYIYIYIGSMRKRATRFWTRTWGAVLPALPPLILDLILSAMKSTRNSSTGRKNDLPSTQCNTTYSWRRDYDNRYLHPIWCMRL